MKPVVRLLVSSLPLLVLPFAGGAVPASSARYTALKANAEKLFAQGSYAQSHELYAQARPYELSKDDARWVAFRLADTEWRSEASVARADDTRTEKARQALEKMLSAAPRAEDRDRTWAEVEESMGDFWWISPHRRNWYQGWQHYTQALDWWAGARDLELARVRYLAIVWRAVQPPGADSSYAYGSYGNVLPVEVAENVLKIAKDPNDRIHAHYLLAIALRNQGDNEQRARVPAELEAALAGGKGRPWYDDALFNYAQYLENNGRVVQKDDGSWDAQPDFVEALALYRRLLKEFRKGETRYWDQAKSQAEAIVKPDLELNVGTFFVPGSEVQYFLGWRNVSGIELALHRADLSSATFPTDSSAGDFVERLPLGEVVKHWTKDVHDKGDHRPGQSSERYEGKLEPGAYVLVATAGREHRRQLVLVGDASLVLKAAASKVLVFVTDINEGAPIAKARVVIWQRLYRDDHYTWKKRTATTNDVGVATVEREQGDEIYAAAQLGGRQTYATGNGPMRASESASWRIYAFTDRPAYRPGDQAQWKLFARVYDGGRYTTPARQTVDYEIHDPQGSKVADGTLTLDGFGSANASFVLTDKMPLGAYQLELWTGGHGTTIGGAALLRLEEYKLPEFTVTVKTPEVDGKRKVFHLGDKVEAQVQVDYYFGGSVANADVEVLVRQTPFARSWSRQRDYPWFYEDIDARPYNPYGWGGGPVIKQEKLKTDGNGAAKVVFDTPRGGQDFEYRIEARVTDASRREVRGEGSVRVTRQPYDVRLAASHQLYRPQDKVTVDVEALDANDQGVAVEGTVVISRDRWLETWLDPRGKEVNGKEYARRTRMEADFSPLGWRLVNRGYHHEELEKRTVKTGPDGKAQLGFTPEREGYYRFAWTSRPRGREAVQADTTVWVMTGATTELGYEHGGLELFVDKDTVRAGGTAPVMISAPTSNRWVLFTVEADELYSWQVLHLTGTVKLLELPIDDTLVPNAFLSASMVGDRQLYADTKPLIVPPVKHYLDVTVTPDASEHRPHAPGIFLVTARDDERRPVSAEVAVGVVDESVYAIQPELAGDPRQFFFGTKRGEQVQTQSTFGQHPFAKLIVFQGTLIDERQKNQMELQLQSGVGGVLGRDEDDREGPARSPAALADAPKDKLESGGAFLGAANQRAAEVSERRSSPPAPPQPSTLAGHAGGGAGNAVPAEPAVVVRSDFRATALWAPSVVTDSDGRAKVTLTYPDSTTAWRATARVATAGAQFGIGTATTRTRMPLLVRLQGPRFFVVGDAPLVSAVVNNDTGQAVSASVELAVEGLKLDGGSKRQLAVPAHGEARADWKVQVERAGTAKLRATARGGGNGDAMEKSFPVVEHGIDKLVARSGKLRGDSVSVTLDLPKERRAGSTQLAVQVSPSLAVTMLDALPYLVDYPYGCTEQTLSRFLPAVIVAQTLKDTGLDPAQAMGRVFGGIEPATAGKTHPEGKRSLEDLGRVTGAGLARLYDFQHGDGGWGWWKQGGSDRFMTAYVLWGLSLARDAGLTVRDDVMARAADYLSKELVQEQDDPDRASWLLNAMASYYAPQKRRAPGELERKAIERVWGSHTRLTAYGRSLFALAEAHYGQMERAQVLVTNLENGVVRDEKPDTSVVMPGQSSSDSVMGTAHWGETGFYWRWDDGPIEATSFALMALVAVDPKSALVEQSMNWLVKNRRGAQWTNTRDTSIAVLALDRYLKTSGEAGGDLAYELVVNGSTVASKKVSRSDALGAPSRFGVDPSLVRDGSNKIEIRRTRGAGPLYFSAEARFFSIEEPVTPAGHEMFVRRQYFKSVGRPTLLKGYVYDRVPLDDNGIVASGDRVEAVLTVEVKNDYEYLLLEDLKPAGLEAVELQSGKPLDARELKSGSFEHTFSDAAGHGAGTDAIDYTGRSRSVYQELRDRKVALFIDKLPQGVWELRYELRAEVPGHFHGLPVMGHAMYVPEIKANGAETRLEVTERAE